jgi:hypothetical protein
MNLRVNIFAASTLVAVALAASCYQQDLALRVHEDGAGTIRISQRVARDLSAKLLETADDASGRDERIQRVLVEELAAWDGVVAWTETRAFERDGEIVLDARGWFQDVKKLDRRAPDGLEHRFDMADSEGSLALVWTLARRPDRPLDSLERVRAAVATVKNVRIEATVAMPDVIFESNGAPLSPNAATFVLFSGTEVAEELRALEARVDAGKMTEPELVAKMRPLLERRSAFAACHTGEAPVAIKEFHDELRAARASYEGSALRRDIEGVRHREGPVR